MRLLSSRVRPTLSISSTLLIPIAVSLSMCSGFTSTKFFRGNGVLLILSCLSLVAKTLCSFMEAY
jgi:hypothetical protein